MNDGQPSKAALASLGGPLAVPDNAALERQGRQVVPHLRQLVRGIPARRRRKAWQRRAAVAGGFAAACTLAVVVWLARGTAPFEVEQGLTASPSDDRHGYVTDASAGAVLRTQRGARVSLSSNTRLSAARSDAQGEVLQLAAGSLHVRVPKLGAGATFSVQTPDSTVTVHGTAFSVTVLGTGSTSRTCVAVSEGLVSVQRGGKRTLVGPGQQLNCGGQVGSTEQAPLQPTPPRAVEVSSPPGAALTPRDRRLGPVLTATPPIAGRATDASLAAQNQLLAAALQAERAGQFAAARAQLQELRRRYPDSPLRADAERSLERVNRKIP